MGWRDRNDEARMRVVTIEALAKGADRGAHLRPVAARTRPATAGRSGAVIAGRPALPAAR